MVVVGFDCELNVELIPIGAEFETLDGAETLKKKRTK